MSKLSEIQSKLKAPKNQYNAFGKYKYRNCEDILEAVKPLIGESVLTLSDDIVEVGGRVYVKATARFLNKEEDLTVTAYARESEDKKGMDHAQVTGAASSYARKYALNGLFLIDDTKDADHEGVSSLQTKPVNKTEEKITSDQVKLLNTRISKLGIDREKFKKFYGVKSLNDTTMPPLNNTYTIMMRREDAEELRIESLSDLAEAINEGVQAPEPGQWIFATNHEYSVREDGYPGLTEHYDFFFEGTQIMDTGITYGALRDGDVALGMGFATDGRIDGFDLVTLEDDQNYHPVYNAAPVIRAETLEMYPEIEEILQPLIERLNDETMQRLNALVDIEGYEPDEAAAEFLEEEGLI